jgi:protein-disulfide isomerase
MIRNGLMALLLCAALALVAGAQTPAAAPADPIVGNPHAAVHLVMYEDLECPKCAAFHQELVSSIIPAYGTRVAFEFRDFHISYHPWSYNAAVIARFLDTKNAKLGMDWRDYCFTHQNDIFAGTLLNRAAAFCAAHGISRDQLSSAFSRTDLFAKLQRDQQLALRDHLTGTPLVLINGAPLPDSATPDDLLRAVAAAVAQRR